VKTLYALIALLIISTGANAQTEPFGKVDTADLKLTTCDFEKGAKAMVLFDKTDINTGFTSTTILKHTRIKILNDAGKDEASISIDYYSAHSIESISDIQAETINLDKNTIQYVKVDANAFYHQTVDKTTKKLTFTFPQVKAGSIIEYAYKATIGFEGGFPDWEFQGTLPVRYCELKASIRNDFAYKMTPRVYQPYDQNTTSLWIKKGDTLGTNYVWALKNVNSYHEEVFSTGAEDDMQKLGFRLTSYRPTIRGVMRSLEKSWFDMSWELIDDEDFGKQWNQDLKADDIISQAKTLSTDEQRISFLFDKVKSNMKWNGVNRWYTEDGIKKAWGKKEGNSAEINLVLYNLLKKTGITCYAGVVSTRSHGKVNTAYPSLWQFNKTIVYVALASKKYYILDASDKYNNYQDIPYDILNTTGLILKPDSSAIYTLLYLKAENPSRKVVFVNADISADGKMSGTTQVNDFSYHKADAIRMYKTDGEQKYKDYLRDDDNNLKIASLKLDNMEVDSLPLTENIDFKLDLTGSDENYIYFSPNLFTGLNSNPFISEQRLADINLKFLRNYSINGRYKMPDGFKIESLPKSVVLVMPDTSITFKRVVAEQEGYVIAHYQINFKKSYYPKEDYPALRAFYKQFHEMLNEQIVLKKT
jgi:Domain of Unknown Function with PDB structure (DUF3857)